MDKKKVEIINKSYRVFNIQMVLNYLSVIQDNNDRQIIIKCLCSLMDNINKQIDEI